MSLTGLKAQTNYHWATAMLLHSLSGKSTKKQLTLNYATHANLVHDVTDGHTQNGTAHGLVFMTFRKLIFSKPNP